MSDAVTQLLHDGEVRPTMTRPPKSHMRVGIALTLLVATIALVVAATLSPTPLDQGYRSSIDKVIDVLHRNGIPTWFDYAEVEFLANVAMFIPVGFFIGLLLGRLMWLGLLLVPALAAGIEWIQAQFLSERFATIQDVIANSVGGWIGIFIAGAVVGLVHARDKKVVERAVWDATVGRRQR